MTSLRNRKMELKKKKREQRNKGVESKGKMQGEKKEGGE